MYKKLRWQFIGVAVSAIFIVLIILVAGINLAHRQVTYRGVDMMLDMISEFEGKIPRIDPRPERPAGINGMGFRFTKETPFDTRYFVITTDIDGNIISSETEHIASVNESNITAYAAKAISYSKETGNVDNFRFRKTLKEGIYHIVFTDITRQQMSINNLLTVSLILMLAAMILTFILVFIMSKKVIAPTIKSIESQKQFITDASHEMKTPLTAIAAYASVIKNDIGENEWTKGIEKETGRLSGLVTDLVELSRWDEFTPLTHVEEFSLTDSIWDVVTPYKNIAAANGKQLISYTEDGLVISGDEISIQKAFSTLLENAIRHSTEGSEIILSASKKRHGIRISLKNACVVDKSLDPNKLFDRFYKIDQSRTRSSDEEKSSGGNGVGLSIAKAIIEAHGGKITARYDTDSSIVFEITL